jgi:hypothetical protein
MIQGNEKGIYRSIYHARSKKKCIYSIIIGWRWNIYFKLNLRQSDFESKNPSKAQNPIQEKAWNPLLVVPKSLRLAIKNIMYFIFFRNTL